MAMVLGVCPKSFPDSKTGEMITGYALRLATDWDDPEGIGFDVDKFFIRNDSPGAMEKVVNYKKFQKEGTNVRILYNRYGKISCLEAM